MNGLVILVVLTFVNFLWVYFWIFRLDVRIERLEDRLSKKEGER